MALTVTVDGNDLTDFLQDRSLVARRNSVDFTLIDPSSVPAVNDTVALTDPTWSGAAINVETVGYKGDVPFIKVRATNEDALVDGGPASFNLSDAPNNSTTFGFKDLEVTSQLRGTTVETRAKCIVYEPGLTAGEEIDITSVAHGYTAETFTIMDLTTEYPTEDGPAFTLDLGLGDFATATTGADGGGPLDPIDLSQGIVDVVTDAGCCGDSGGGGGSGSSGDGNGITDTFTRSANNVDGDLSDSGVAYDVTDSGGTPASAASDGSKLDVTLTIGNASHPQHIAQLLGTWPMLYNAQAKMDFSFDGDAIVASGRVWNVGGQLRSEAIDIYVDCQTGMGAPFSYIGFPGANSTPIPTAYWVAGRTYTITGVDDGTNTTYTLSDNTTIDYTISRSAARTSAVLSNPYFTVRGDTTGITATDTIHVYIDNLDLPEVRAVTVQGQANHRPVYIEYTTLAALGASPESQTADTYYDYTFGTVTADALLAVGFYTADDITFTATRAGLVAITSGFTLDPTPTTPSLVVISTPGLSGGIGYKFSVNDTTDIPLNGTVWFEVGDFVRLDIYGTVTDQPVTYGWIGLARVD